MKATRKLLRLSLVLLLVIFTLSSGMVVSATNKKSDRAAFSSITIGGKKPRDWSDYPEVNPKSKKAKVKVKLKKGWKLKKIRYYDADKDKTCTVKNGGTIKTNRIIDSYITKIPICTRVIKSSLFAENIPIS
jgi:hypothetical protein